jgi:hypothetical protein
MLFLIFPIHVLRELVEMHKTTLRIGSNTHVLPGNYFDLNLNIPNIKVSPANLIKERDCRSFRQANSLSPMVPQSLYLDFCRRLKNLRFI